MSDLLRTYKIWKGTDFKDRDMEKVFYRHITKCSVIELIDLIQDLSGVLSFIKHETECVKLSGPIPPKNELEMHVVHIGKAATQALKKMDIKGY